LEEGGRSAQARRSLSTPAIWALLDLDAFYVSVERAKDPSLEGKPVIVGGDPLRGRGIVASASYEARAFGVRTAMPARAAARLCPEAVFLRPDFPSCSEFSARARAILESEAPEVLPASIDEFYLDFGIRAGFDFDLAFAAVSRLRARLRSELRLPSSAGVAVSRLAAKIACGKAKPSGQILLRPGEEAAFLAPLPIEEMPGVGPKSAPRFLAAGFRTIGDLVSRPEGERRTFFGKHAEYWRRRGLGQDIEEEPTHPREHSVGAEETFDSDLTDPARIESELAALSETACYRLRQEGKLAASLSLKIRYENFETISASFTFPEPTDSYEEIRAAASRSLARRFDRRRKLRLLGVRLEGLLEPRERELLFVEKKEDRARKTFDAVDRIKEKFGEGSLHFAGGSRAPRPRGRPPGSTDSSR
jgi:DNA polymerase-4